MSAFPTPIQDIALSLVFTVMGGRYNRLAHEYATIAERLPPLP